MEKLSLDLPTGEISNVQTICCAPLKTGEIVWKKCIESFSDVLVKGNIYKSYDVSPHGTAISSNGKFVVWSDGSRWLEPIEDDTPTITPHPHADLMLKYAMIAQYDDKPWENFEYYSKLKEGWRELSRGIFFNDSEKYRLKPQEPKIQVGQIWVSKEGVEVVIDTPSGKDVIYFAFTVGGLHISWSVKAPLFLRNFKRKDK